MLVWVEQGPGKQSTWTLEVHRATDSSCQRGTRERVPEFLSASAAA